MDSLRFFYSFFPSLCLVPSGSTIKVLSSWAVRLARTEATY